jgi:hypothetical protein
LKTPPQKGGVFVFCSVFFSRTPLLIRVRFSDLAERQFPLSLDCLDREIAADIYNAWKAQ